MHFHHRHDIPGCTSDHPDWPDWATTILATLDRMELQIMTANQDAIDALNDRIAAAEARIAAKLGEPAPAEALDLSGLSATADKLDALVPVPAPSPEPAPVADPAPADAPAAADVPAEPAPADPAPADDVQPVQSIPSVPSVPLA